MKRRKKTPAKRNPIAKAAKKIRPQVVPDTRRKKLARAERRDTDT
jgi:hypothetical protein